jgi:hypothetical protein
MYCSMLEGICGEMLTVALKVNTEHHELFEAIAVLVERRGLEFCGARLEQFVGKILGVINRVGSKGAQESHLNVYMVCVG